MRESMCQWFLFGKIRDPEAHTVHFQFFLSRLTRKGDVGIIRIQRALPVAPWTVSHILSFIARYLCKMLYKKIGSAHPDAPLFYSDVDYWVMRSISATRTLIFRTEESTAEIMGVLD